MSTCRKQYSTRDAPPSKKPTTLQSRLRLLPEIPAGLFCFRPLPRPRLSASNKKRPDFSTPGQMNSSRTQPKDPARTDPLEEAEQTEEPARVLVMVVFVSV
jgi:hypothetical protein